MVRSVSILIRARPCCPASQLLLRQQQTQCCGQTMSCAYRQLPQNISFSFRIWLFGIDVRYGNRLPQHTADSCKWRCRTVHLMVWCCGSNPRTEEIVGSFALNPRLFVMHFRLSPQLGSFLFGRCVAQKLPPPISGPARYFNRCGRRKGG